MARYLTLFNNCLNTKPLITIDVGTYFYLKKITITLLLKKSLTITVYSVFQDL
jgi:hypothetical protein